MSVGFVIKKNKEVLGCVGAFGVLRKSLLWLINSQDSHKIPAFQAGCPVLGQRAFVLEHLPAAAEVAGKALEKDTGCTAEDVVHMLTDCFATERLYCACSAHWMVTRALHCTAVA
jgi:hypothetical protein